MTSSSRYGRDIDALGPDATVEQRQDVKERWVRRHSRGFQRFIRTCERIRRRDAGQPVLELMKNKDSVRARESE